jgi:hypothetical protein
MAVTALAMLGSKPLWAFCSIEDDQSMVNLDPRLLAF